MPERRRPGGIMRKPKRPRRNPELVEARIMMIQSCICTCLCICIFICVFICMCICICICVFDNVSLLQLDIEALIIVLLSLS